MAHFYKDTNKLHNYGDFSMLSVELLRELQKLCDFLGQELQITSGYRASDTSQHGQGLAVDIVPTKPIKLLDLYLAAERFKFTGIGVYPDWSNGKLITGGLHLDIRPAGIARWFGFKQDGANIYKALSFEVLKQHGVI